MGIVHMNSLSIFEREMKAEARKAPNEFVRERRLIMASNARTLVEPADGGHKKRLVANLENQASGIAAHRQAQQGEGQ
jgi:hypothetical protein